ncbi:MAG: hypothetical protein DRI90_10540 [Deltaproteobacteria bacterium]|nr:MAG: hypothetical protein DRI90_10540 [Deltaproteobacteria bacterium]
MKDIWCYAIERARAARSDEVDPERPAGRVLRVKGGYNPNSSSVGSSIPMYLIAAAGSGALTVVLLNAMAVVGKLLRKDVVADPSKGGAPLEGDEGDDPVERQSD